MKFKDSIFQVERWKKNSRSEVQPEETGIY